MLRTNTTEGAWSIHTKEKGFYGMCYLSREVCVVFARDGIRHSAKGSFLYAHIPILALYMESYTQKDFDLSLIHI